MRLSGKVAIVTGAGSGMGLETAKLFAQEGAKLVLSDINQDRIDALVDDLSSQGFTVEGVLCDVSDRSSVEGLLAKAIESYGHYDILVNNAGIMDGMEGIESVTEEKWDKIFAVNTKSLLYAIQPAVRYFKENGIKGSIVNNLSLGALYGARAGVAYTASKHAAAGITKNTAFIYGPDGIRCNAIAPGAVATNISETMTDVDMDSAQRIGLGRATMPHPGSPLEAAQAILFLASDEASYINGAILTVDGGWASI
ncbi:glucose 1-dehydrogenase [Streptococcus moroccensis]|uniref:NAD(P)-dependent dehydrogenase (Short-subunit alcohol dehydrogenase family) n=1 Tax=Streptococcus moroccensis TaxID=1451356 RepID=A0ABT9YV42_9STRE|nr:glucose 1-dehydrogenase [Streptococcus moroccensis]MDQ0222965.1 NAD(P)-dependent dehydrogenase (short-subunit alcohol dehydrogenase family) [Streptococcus moroccensis]